MEHIGIDVHLSESQICILTEAGEVLETRIQTRRERFQQVLGSRARARILIEASTESEWVARCVEELGHEVIVADPNFAPMYATRSRRIKTDRRDAQALMDACRLGAYRPAHRLSEVQRQVRAELVVRDALVRTRVRYVALIRALLRQQGVRVRSGYTPSFGRRAAEAAMSSELRATVGPLLELLEPVSAKIAEADRVIADRAQGDPVVRRLRSVPGVGAVTAVAFVATLDRVDRFDRAHDVESYLGLVPREQSSGERCSRGRIVKTGSARMRWLLMEAAWCLLRQRRTDLEPIQRWANKIAMRRGKKIAVVALARRLAGILYALWRDGSTFRGPLACADDQRLSNAVA
jgi:transposase